MEVVLFYAVLIGGLGMIVSVYAMLLLAACALVGLRFGYIFGGTYAAGMAAAMYALFVPPYGGASLDFAPAGMRPNLILVGLVQEPPVASIVAGAVIAVAGLLAVLIASLVRRTSPQSS